jgi:hypothetical protein
MKKKNQVLGYCGIFLCMTLVLVGCWTTGTPGGTGRVTNSQMKLLEPSDVVGKKLVGSDKDIDYGFLLSQDGSLEYTVDDMVYNGTWTFDKKREMLRFNLEWMEGSDKQGYMVNFIANGPEITISGYWYITTAYKTFLRIVAFES